MAIFEPAFEEIVLGLLATNRKFWGSFGAHLLPDYFSEGAAQGLFKVLTEIAAEVKWPGGTETATQGLRQELESGRMSTPVFRSACRILFNADLMPGDEAATRYMLKAILQKKKRLEATTEIVEAVAAKKGQEGVGDLGKKLDAVERLGDSDESPGMELDQELFNAIDDAQVRQRITTGVPELDIYLSGGLPRGSTGIVIGSSGGGKCLAPGTPVLMYDGRVLPVEQVQTGDRVMGPDSTPRTVLGTTTGVGPLYKIIPVKGDPWICNDAHVLTLWDSPARRVVDIPLADFLRLPPYRRVEHKQIRTRADFPPHAAPPPIDPYFLGVWLGDGSKTLVGATESGPRGYEPPPQRLHTVQVTKPDPEILAVCREVAASFGCEVISHNKNASGTNQEHRIVYRGARGRAADGAYYTHPVRMALSAAVNLTTWEVSPRYLTGSRDERLAFLAGLLDTDGYHDRGSFDFVQKKKGIFDAAVFVARSLGLCVTTRTKIVNGCLYHRACISGHTDEIPNRLPRKKATARRQVKNPLFTGVSVEPAGLGPYYGFQVDGDSRFLLGDFTVTHNSLALSQFAAAAIMKEIPTYYITLEIDVPTVGARVLSPMLGISIDKVFLYSKKIPDIIRTRRLKLAPIIIKDMPGLTTTATGCVEWIKRTIDQKGQRPSLICYDYLDRFGGVAKATRQQKNSYEHFADVTQELHDFGQAYGHASWTAVQSTRQQKRARGAAQNITLDDAADSLHKIRIADVVLTLNLSTELDPLTNKTTQYIQGYLAKNRHGPGDKRMTKTPVNYAFGQVFPTNVFPAPREFVNINELDD